MSNFLSNLIKALVAVLLLFVVVYIGFIMFAYFSAL